MFSPALRRLFAVVLLVGFGLSLSVAQTRPAKKDPRPPQHPEEVEILKTDTDLVTVPVIATDIVGGLYVSDLRKEEFTISEDGVQQEIAFFGKVAAPFHVVLMLDTSSSTQDKLRQIQQAASAFVDELQPADRVKVISFDDKVKDWNEFTNRREVLKNAINGTRSGSGTKVYDAVELALNSIRSIRGRKAIVLFSDGMDWHSDTASFDGTLRWLDEEGVIIYPIRYDTRATTERLAREQADAATTPQLPTIDVIRRPPSGTTAPTFPGGDPVPTVGTQRRTGPFGLPLPEDIMRRRREDERNRDPRRPPNDDPQLPPDVNPRDRQPPGPLPGPTTTRGTRGETSDDSITRMLDLAYSKADSYLEQLAEKSGGRLLRADTLASLPDAFSKIAAELRTQYMLGYYPKNKDRDDRYRNIKVTTARKNVALRSRPGYIASSTK
ncbi:MAG TPA: VWA domain-containing protein [Pyrinomonadaceae bacterium]|nr:VWA domain-containing protein [Pyrinomonadaceae bacterium]